MLDPQKPPTAPLALVASRAAAPILVPIRSLGVGHRERIASHLLALDTRDRYLRFGYNAADRNILAYVDGLNFAKDDIFGIYNRKLELIAMAHLAYSVNPQFKSCAEFGVSVRPTARGRGYGARLFDRATMHASNEGVELLFVHALSENTAMLKIARKAGATVERDGSEAEAFLRLSPATLDSRVTEMLAEQMAQTDYQFKTQAKNFWDLLSGLQSVRQGIKDARHKSAA
ncbi:MAG: GNAT family N-acetyltransferase [Rhodoferax sp.]|uniref:GNAT family N-acetyltransferase n=1 Tax=Rhodoferax sp. TaxID=50421 RepID=UPI003262E30A